MTTTVLEEELLGKEHLEKAISLTNLANLCRSEGRLEKAERLYLRALSIFDAEDPTHPKRKACLRNHARLLDELDALRGSLLDQEIRIRR